jgi:hypothetical protein
VSAKRILAGRSEGRATGGGARRSRSAACGWRVLPGVPLARPKDGGDRRYRSVARAWRIMSVTRGTGTAWR